mgnify:CR=1 FL=1
MSDLNHDLYLRHLRDNPSCACGSQVEDAAHYLLECPLYDAVRETTILASQSHRSAKDLLYGNPALSTHVNEDIFLSVQEFIYLSGRFAA